MRESAVDKAVRVLQAGIGVKAGTDEIQAAARALRKLPAVAKLLGDRHRH